jgi:hypothetical protein
MVLELPAGLVDSNEIASQAGLRELKEETGFYGRVMHTTPVIFSDPGLSNANMQFVHVLVDPNCTDPQQNLEDGEFIEVLRFPIENLLDHLERHVRQHGGVIDARLYHYALGMKFCSLIPKTPCVNQSSSPLIPAAYFGLGVLASVASFFVYRLARSVIRALP